MEDHHRLSDRQIAAHEAGHAIVGHLLGERIHEVHTYSGPQSAKVCFERAVEAEQVRLAGSIGELIAGFPTTPTDACSDMNGVDLYNVREEPGACALLQAHVEAHRALTDLLSEAREVREVLAGIAIHDYLEQLGCPFAGAVPAE